MKKAKFKIARSSNNLGTFKDAEMDWFFKRTLEYAAVPDHPKFHDLWKRSRDCFHKACPLFEPAIQIIEVPFEGKKLPAYFWAPDDSGKKRPTMFSVGGNDSSGEEVWYWSAQAAVDRGYNFFTFEFPGHRGTVHLYHDCVKRHDMEKPFSAAFDVLEKLPGVDERIALAGHSFGGYVVSRVAIFEKRVKAVIPSSPLIDINRAQKAMLNKIKIPLNILAWLTEIKMKKSPLMKSMMYLAMWNSGYAGQYSAREVYLPLSPSFHYGSIPTSRAAYKPCRTHIGSRLAPVRPGC